MNAYQIKIECEDDGFHIVIDGDSIDPEYQAGCYSWRIKDPEALYDHVKASIGPWLRERDEAKATMPEPRLSDDEFDAYVSDAYADNWAKAEGMRQMREQGYC